MTFVTKKLKDLVSFNTIYLGMNRTQLNNFSNTGKIPVYSADSSAIYHLSDIDNLKLNAASKENRKLSLATNGDGSAGKNFIIHDTPFGITADRIVLTPFDKNLNIEYLRFALDDIKRKYNFNRAFKALKKNIENIEIKIPITSDNLFDIDKQIYLYTKFVEVQNQKKYIYSKLEEFNNCHIEIPLSEYKIHLLKITELFTPNNGDSDLTKSYCETHKGSYPVFSGNTQGEYAKIDSYDYDGEYLTWAKDGLAGLMMYHNEKFSVTGHRGILLPTEKCKNIDLKYIKYVLEPIFRKNIKGRRGDLGKNEYTTLNSDMIRKLKDTVPVPVREDGSFDLDAQKEIASKYEQIEMIKKNLSEKVERLINVSVE